MEPNLLSIVVLKNDVLSKNTRPTVSILQSLLSSPDNALKWHERVDISFEGYDGVPQELFEIQEVREFVKILDDVFPYWLFFLSKADFGLQCIILCFLPPFLTDDAKARIFPERVGSLLEKRWLPAEPCLHICGHVRRGS
jgi:hypothetical protein